MPTDFTREGIEKLLKEYNVRLVEESVAHSEEEAVRLAKKIGFPVVLKIISDEILHKTDRGCVKVDLMNEGEVRTAYRHIMANAAGAKFDGMLVQKMVRKGLELIVGGKKDEQFGPVIMFGLGGVYVEVFKDVSIRVCPLSRSEAHEMISEIRGYPLLRGVRGIKPVDIDLLAELLVNVSKLLYENQQMCELDLNPIIAYEDGYLAVDVRAIKCPLL